jgi:hypothetical protein
MAGTRTSVTLANGRRYSGPLYAIDELSRRSPVTDSARPTTAPERRPQSTHVHLHDVLGATVRDQAPAPLRRPAPRRGDQGREPTPGALLCKIAQDGRDGSWKGVDSEGRPLGPRWGRRSSNYLPIHLSETIFG